jgi:signal transduction histidine kinase
MEQGSSGEHGRVVSDSESSNARESEPLDLICGVHGNRVRLVVITALIAFYMLVSVYFHLVEHTSVAYSHLAYLPILLTGLWWGRRAILVAALLSCEMLTFQILIPANGPLWATLVRMFFFFLTAVVVGELSRRVILTQRALCENENRLRRTNASLRTLSRLRRDFLHIAVHDMKSPVSAAKMLLHSLQTLLEDRLDPREEHLIERMHHRLDEASSFLRDFQFFAALEDTSQVRKNARRTDLNDILTRVAAEQLHLAADNGHTLSVDPVVNLPCVAGIDRLLSEVVTNLVTNAVKYTPAGGSIILRSLVTPEGNTRIEVEDNGIGISQENQKLLFREFVRLKDNEVSGRKVPGIGLGLSIVRRIVEMHGGKVFLRSEPEKGSVFGFDLPACPEGVVDDSVILPMRRLASKAVRPPE